MNADTSFAVRPARDGDAVLLPGIQLSAGKLFRALPDIAWVADEPVDPPKAYLPLIAGGTVWVAEAADRTVVGCLLAERAGDALHILEVAVAEMAQRLGLGRRLLDAARAFAAAQGLAALTLTTFRHVAWNAPFYARYGFHELAPDEPDARLTAILATETRRGLPQRCAMRLVL